MSVFSDKLKDFPTLTTPRLTLRQIQSGDAPSYFAQLTALPHTSSWSDSYEAQSLENCQRAIQTYANQFQRTKTVIPWVLVDRQDHLIGFVKLFDIQNRSKAELGYWLGTTQWGQGLMTEAVCRITQFAFFDLDMHRIYATTNPQNTASQRVLEKVGFQREGVMRQHGRLAGEWTDALLFGILRTDNLPNTAAP